MIFRIVVLAIFKMGGVFNHNTDHDGKKDNDLQQGNVLRHVLFPKEMLLINTLDKPQFHPKFYRHFYIFSDGKPEGHDFVRIAFFKMTLKD